MDSDKNFLKTKSEKILKTVNNELKKFSPSGASNRRIPIIPKLPKSQTERLAKKIYNTVQNHKVFNAPLMNFLESNYKVKDIYTRSARNSIDKNRNYTASPKVVSLTPDRTPDRSPELIRKKSLQKMIEGEENLPRSSSPNLIAVNAIIDACERVGSPKERTIPLELKGCSQKIDKLKNQLNKKLIKESETAQIKDIEERLNREFYVDGRREMVETEVLDKKIKRETFKIRQYSMPKHLDNFLKQHTRF